jgi:glucokinase
MHYLGIEIGGTKLQLGIGPGDGTLAGLWRGTVDPDTGGEGIRKQITAAVPELLASSGLDRSQLKGVGIGFGGPVDDASRTVITSHQIEGWDGFPLADWIRDITGLPAVLGNDADVAGLAEALFGAGKGLSPIFYITIGSGIGGGLIINGEVYRGCGRGAAEIGHLTVVPDVAFLRQFGFSGYQVLLDEAVIDGWGKLAFPLEGVSSGWSLNKMAWWHARMDPARAQTLLRLAGGRYDLITAEHVAEAAVRNDVLAQCLLHHSWKCLAQAICHAITLLCPRRIVIGGGVSLMGEKLLFEPLRKLVAERVFAPFAGCYDIVPAALGEAVVVHGALALARKRLGP